METVKKYSYGLPKTKYMIVGRGQHVEVKERVRDGNVMRTSKHKYMGIMHNEEGNLENHIIEMSQKCEVTCREIIRVGSRSQVGGESLRVRLELYEKCLVPVLTYGLTAMGNITIAEVKKLEQMQGRCLKRMLELPDSTPYSGIIMETGVWPLSEKLGYSLLMMYHSIMNSDDNRIAKKVLEEQERSGEEEGTVYGRVVKTARNIGVNIAGIKTSKSKWKKECKEKTINKIRERLQKEIEGKTKTRMMQRDKWERKAYINEMSGNMALQVIKIRLNMWPLKANYKKENADRICPKCQEHEDTTEHVVQCFSKIDPAQLRNTSRGQWDDLIKAFNDRKKIGEEDEKIHA